MDRRSPRQNTVCRAARVPDARCGGSGSPGYYPAVGALDWTVLDAIALSIVVLDRGGRVVFWNRAHTDLVGLGADEAAGRNATELMTSAGEPSLPDAIDHVLAGHREATLQVAWQTRAGNPARQTLILRRPTPVAGGELVIATATPSSAPAAAEAIHQAFALAPLGILILSRDGAVTFNPQIEQILGMRLSSAGGNQQYLSLMRRPDGNPMTLDQLPSTRALRRAETVAAEELVVHRHDGTRAIIRESAGPVHGNDGDVHGSVVVVEDITERARLDAALRAAHARMDGIVSLTTDAIIVIDDAQRIVAFNEGAQQIFGWMADEVIGKPVDVLVPERLRERHHADVEAFARGPVGARRMHGTRPTIPGVRRNGEEFQAEAGISKVDVGGATLMTVMLRDVSQGKQEENRQRFLAHAGAVLASSLDYADTLTVVARLAVPVLADVCLVDLLEERGAERVVRRLKAVHVDPTQGALAAGLEAVEIRDPGTHPVWRVLEERRPLLLPNVQIDALEAMAQTPEHLRLLRDLAPTSIVAVPLVARDRVLGALWFVSTRPDSAYAQDDLKLAEELARRAALAIDNAQLYTLSRRAILARDEVIGVVAHDLRNPLNSIKLRAELLARSLSKHYPDARPSVDALSREVDRADRLIEDLLDVTSIEAGRLAVTREPCAPADLLDEAIDAMRPAAEHSSVELSRRLDEQLPMVAADRHRILQVFSNLAGNALKFTPAGGRVQLAAERRGDAVCFSVADTGPGIPADHLPHLFDRFWQARPTDRRGAGLGLAISKGIVEAHGGQIWVESTVGAGSAFYFTISAHRAGEVGT